MRRFLRSLGLAGMLVIGIVSLQAQFARVPQDYAAGQYPPVSDGTPPNGPVAPAAAPDAGDGQHSAARISLVQGDVNVRRGDTSELVAAAPNAPLLSQDRLQTADGSRAEIELDSAHSIRLAPNTDVGLADLQYRRFQVQLGAGTIMYRVLRPSESEGEVDTPSIALRALGEGAYRISVLTDGTTQIDVRAGAAEIVGPRGSQRIDAGRSVVVRGDPADPEFMEVQPSPRDQFDDWSEGRDRELLSSQSYQYVGPDVSGAEDLDANGSWVPSQYGQAWEPRAVAQDWAPYSYGQWNWEPYYGWTWVDYAPWGWAPYHYGRWFWNGGYGWCWWPGPRLSVHFWSPALVGFFGWRNGAIGWAALAPYERFQPWWGRGVWGGAARPYGPGGFYGLRNVNVWSAYRNTAFRGGAVFAASNGFGGPHQRFGFATRDQLGGANFFQGRLPVGPTRASYSFTNRQATINPRLSSTSNMRFFQYRQTARQNGSVMGNARPNTGRANNYGWQRFGDPGAGSSYRQGFASGSNGESGWHQFGRPQPTSPSPSYRPPAQSYRPSYSYRPYNGGGIANRSYSPPPRYSSPAQQHYNPPAQPRYSSGGGGYSHGSGASARGGGGGSHISSGGGRHGR